MYRLISLAIFLLLSINSFGQKIYHPGQIIQNDGELIDCLIQEDIPANYEKRVQFKRNKNSKLEVKHANEIKGFHIDGKEKYRSFVIKQKISNSAGSFMYKRSPIFIQQLEEGAINLYLYKEGEENWLYVQKENEEIKKLELIRIEYASRSEKDKIIKIDTLCSSTKPSRNGFYKLQKKYIKTISTLIDDPQKLKEIKAVSLNKKLIRAFVKKYNDKHRKELKAFSYFKKSLGGRFFLVGGGMPLGDFTIGLVGVELEIIFPSKKRETCLSFGFIKGTNIKKGAIDYNGNILQENFPSSQFYARLNQYLFIGNKIKPYILLGLKFNSILFNGPPNFSLWKNPPELAGAQAFFHFGIGVLYLVKEDVSVKIELTNRFFPDVKIGVGKQF